MAEVKGYTLVCPIRGRLAVTGRSKDGLKPSEERYRVEALQHLVDHGYPAANFVVEPVVQHLGNAGRNSLRADFAVLDIPARAHMPTDEILQHALVLGEVKRDHKDAVAATEFQVKPLLAFAANSQCVAILWDDVEQTVFWNEFEAGKKVTKRGPIEILPSFGQEPGMRPLGLLDLRRDPPLRDIFQRIEILLHAEGIAEAKRFKVMLQLLLAKIYDEIAALNQPGKPLRFQDFQALGYGPGPMNSTFQQLVEDAVSYYQGHLPEALPTTALVKDELLGQIAAILAPYRVTAASHTVIQNFYMYFARGMYRWDLAQYFTPPRVTNFIVDIIAPRWNESVLDPACGSADFLTSAYRRGVELGYTGYADKMHGYDSSAESVQVAVLNMVLNGDGKSNIRQQDSLKIGDAEANNWDVIVCNPPFGRKIVESKKDTLNLFDMGSSTYKRAGKHEKQDLVARQEVGILFTELVVRLTTSKNGRVALVLPNGYLGNVSDKYVELRKWLLRHVKLAAIVALPRFTFKSSGADVSASVLFLEKREAPLMGVPVDEDYHVAVHVIDHVGWQTGDKKGAPTYRRDPDTGNLLLDAQQAPIIEADFDNVLDDIRNSAAAQDFPWLAHADGSDLPDGSGYSIPINDILSDPHLTLDAKRYCKKVADIRSEIEATDHFRLGDVVSFISERTTSEGVKVTKSKSGLYNYVELQDVDSGAYRYETMRGWELPDRARHFAEPRDIFIGSVWGSVRKWFIAGDNIDSLVVTNGMHRLRVKPGHEDRLVDIVAGLTSEAYAAQMRSLARGSDGLAEVRPEELFNVVLPKIPEGPVRKTLEQHVDQLTSGMTSIEATVRLLAAEGKLPTRAVEARTSHTQLV